MPDDDRDEPHLEKPAGSRVYRTYVWIADPATGGRRRRYFTTGCRGKKAARKRALEIEREAQDPHLAVARRTTIEGALALWMDGREAEVKAGNLARETFAYYDAKAKALIKVLGALLLSQIDSAAAAIGYVERRRADGAGQHTIRKELDVLRWSLELARRLKLWSGIVDDVMPERFGSGYQPVERVVSIGELQAILPRLDQDNAARAAWMVASSGEWGASTRALRVDVARGAVLVRGTKNEHRERTVPLATDWQRSLMDYALTNGQGQGGALFRDLSRNAMFQDLRRACRDAGFQPGGLAPVSANDLRRTCATWLLAGGASFDDVAKVLGHADTRMLHKVYGRISTEELRSRLQHQLGIERRTAVADGDGIDGIGGPVGQNEARKAAESGIDGVADGTRTRNTWSHSPSPLWPVGRKNSRIGECRRGWRSSGVARQAAGRKPGERGAGR